jgi:hypothetical protein
MAVPPSVRIQPSGVSERSRSEQQPHHDRRGPRGCGTEEKTGSGQCQADQQHRSVESRTGDDECRGEGEQDSAGPTEQWIDALSEPDSQYHARESGEQAGQPRCPIPRPEEKERERRQGGGKRLRPSSSREVAAGDETTGIPSQPRFLRSERV